MTKNLHKNITVPIAIASLLKATKCISVLYIYVNMHYELDYSLPRRYPLCVQIIIGTVRKLEK